MKTSVKTVVKLGAYQRYSNNIINHRVIAASTIPKTTSLSPYFSSQIELEKE